MLTFDKLEDLNKEEISRNILDLMTQRDYSSNVNRNELLQKYSSRESAKILASSLDQVFHLAKARSEKNAG